MTDRRFNTLTLTEQRAFAKRVSAGLPGTDYRYFKLLVQVNPLLKNCGIRGVSWAYMDEKSFDELLNLLQ